MKNLKKVLAVLLSACFVLSFAACSGDSGNSTPADDDKSSEESKNEGGDGDSDEYDYYSDYAQDISGDIEFYQQKPEIEDYMYEVIDDFNAVYPNITVTQNVQNDAASNLQTRAASGDFTDIWLYWPTDMVWQSFYDEGLLMLPISPTSRPLLNPLKLCSSVTASTMVFRKPTTLPVSSRTSACSRTTALLCRKTGIPSSLLATLSLRKASSRSA